MMRATINDNPLIFDSGLVGKTRSEQNIIKIKKPGNFNAVASHGE